MFFFQSNHVRCLNDFVTSQIEFYHQSYRHILDLQQELSKPVNSRLELAPNPTTTTSTTSETLNQTEIATIDTISSTNHSKSTFVDNVCSIYPSLPNGKRRARCLNNYDSQNNTELSLRSEEIIIVSSDDSCLDSDWMIGERGTEKGKVPVAYLEILN